MGMEMTFNFTDVLRSKSLITIYSSLLWQRHEVGGGRRERLNSSAPYRHEHELSVPDWRQ